MEYAKASVYEKDGKLYGRLRYKDESGKWRSKTKVLKATGKRAAQAEADAWRDDMNEAEARKEAEAKAMALRAAGAPGPNETVAEYLARYIDGKKLTIEKSTLVGYLRTLNVHVLPYPIGEVPLDDLTPDIVHRWVEQLSEVYAPRTVRRSFVVFKGAMTQAVESGRLDEHPCRTVKPPKVPQKNPNSLDAASFDRLTAVLDAPSLSPMLLAVKIALQTGMREGEVCALRWRNVDLREGTIKVVEALGREKGGTYYIKDVKNGSSRRTLSITEATAASLAERRAAMGGECLAAGLPFTDDLFVVGRIDGAYMVPNDLSKKWTAFAKALDLTGTEGERPTFHDLRHTYASQAIRNSIDVKTVSSQLGHANAAMTLNIYASADPDAKRHAAERMDEVFAAAAERGKRGPRVVDAGFRTGTEG